MSEATKTCTKCGEEFPATLEFFYNNPRMKSGLTSWCRGCYERAYPRVRPKKKPASEGMKRCTSCEEEFPANTDYFYSCATGKYGVKSECKECSRKRSLQWIEEHPQSEEFKQAKSEYDKQYYEEHKEQIKQRVQQYRLANLEECNAKSRQRHWANKEVANERTRQWFADHPQARLAYHMTRKARKLGNGGTHTAQDRLDQVARQKGKCFWCKKKLGDDYQIDHVIPLALGGSNGPENLVASCPECNLSKRAKHPMDWAGILL